MAATKFRFEVIGATEVLDTLKRLTAEHSHFVAETIASEQHLTALVREMVNERIALYAAYARAMKSASSATTSDVKRMFAEQLKYARDNASEEVKIEQTKQRHIREEHEKTHRDTFRWYGRGGLSEKGNFYGTAGVSAVGGAGAMFAGASMATAEISGSIKQGVSSAVDFARGQFQQLFQESDVISSILATSQPGTNLSRAGLKNWAMQASEKTGASREDIETMMYQFQMAGGTISETNAMQLASEHRLDPLQDKGQLATGLGTISNIITDQDMAAKTYRYMKYASSLGGKPITSIMEPAIEESGILTAKGMYGGDRAKALQDVARKMQALSIEGMTPGQVRTAMGRFEIDVANSGIDVRGKTMDQIEAEFATKHNINLNSPTLEQDLKRAGLKKEPGKTFFELEHAARGMGGSLGQLANNAPDLNASEARAQAKEAEHDTDPVVETMRALNSIFEGLRTSAEPAIMRLAGYITNHQTEIAMFFDSLVMIFEKMVDFAVKNPEMAKFQIAQGSGGLLAALGTTNLQRIGAEFSAYMNGVDVNKVESTQGILGIKTYQYGGQVYGAGEGGRQAAEAAKAKNDQQQFAQAAFKDASFSGGTINVSKIQNNTVEIR